VCLVTFALLLCAGSAWGQNAVPLLQPHKYFVDGSGNPCVGCTLGSYLAGTTTPTPTYTDSSKTTQNPNPVVLDATGQANIWLDPSIVYKFVLQNALGTTLWTADNVSTVGNGAINVCGPASTIQIANSSINGLTCDPNITINTASHTLLVGGAISGAHFNLVNLATIPATWTFDVTTPVTALASLSPIPLTDMASQAADTVLGNASASTAAPTAVPLPSGCTAINYASHSFSCATVATLPLALSDLATQAADTVVGNFTGSTAVPTAASIPNCPTGLTYNTSTHTLGCATSTAVDQYFSVTGCLVGGSTDNQCSGSFNLTAAMADSSYEVFGQTNNLGGTQNILLTITSATLPATPNTLVNYVLTCTFGCSSTVTPTLYIHAHHN
jgi:hypothetical protein